MGDAVAPERALQFSSHITRVDRAVQYTGRIFSRIAGSPSFYIMDEKSSAVELRNDRRNVVVSSAGEVEQLQENGPARVFPERDTSSQQKIASARLAAPTTFRKHEFHLKRHRYCVCGVRDQRGRPSFRPTRAE